MKVLIVNNMQPFVWGGAEELAVNLQKNLVIAGHEAEVLRIPFQWEPASRIVSQMLMVRAFELMNVDHVIALKFPAYMIRQVKKTLWLVHQYRQAYDLLETEHTNLPADRFGEQIRTLIKNGDNETFRECRHIFAISEVVRKRLLHHNGFDAEVLLPPLNSPELFIGGKYGDYIFAGGRINRMKRQHLLVEALSLADSNIKLIIAGPPDTEEDGNNIRAQVERLGLKDRVKLDLRFLPQETYTDYVNGSGAVACVPFDEDYGYVAVEAAASAKAIIATSDSGWVLRLAKHKQTGWIAEPTPSSLAAAMNAMWGDRPSAQAYGYAARQAWQELNINWPTTVDKLLR